MPSDITAQALQAWRRVLARRAAPQSFWRIRWLGPWHQTLPSGYLKWQPSEYGQRPALFTFDAFTLPFEL